jgi:hypothetical protein
MISFQLDKILFLDIETVPLVAEMSTLSPEMSHLWKEKAKILRERNPERFSDVFNPEEMFETTAGIYAEFGKIVCVSVGFMYFNEQNELCIRTKSFCGDDEKQILIDFSALLQKFIKSSEYTLCGHNIKEFDVPYICRRMLINGIQLPNILRISGKKPWEINFLDTLELWKFGDYKNYTSLKLLTTIMGIPSPKDDIDGSQVAEVYYKERNVNRIAVYCEKDVVATAQLLLRLSGKELIQSNNIMRV